ncbi:hypothetical protein E2C01_078343 [Portunus trituberculatus]|uniref:Uncharacterized protein n=1 Tax=Portunus trituberculatus TaxID=210409 RepID=A0A5B7INL5_PORTR|nr:hypothetical protein [Portunus trituberculatus]
MYSCSGRICKGRRLGSFLSSLVGVSTTTTPEQLPGSPLPRTADHYGTPTAPHPVKMLPTLTSLSTLPTVHYSALWPRKERLYPRDIATKWGNDNKGKHLRRKTYI